MRDHAADTRAIQAAHRAFGLDVLAERAGVDAVGDSCGLSPAPAFPVTTKLAKLSVADRHNFDDPALLSTRYDPAHWA